MIYIPSSMFHFSSLPVGVIRVHNFPGRSSSPWGKAAVGSSSLEQKDSGKVEAIEEALRTANGKGILSNQGN